MELEACQADKAMILKIFAETLTGECDPNRILINLTDGSVQWSAVGTRPGMPSQVNGLPLCVMAPDDGDLVEPSCNGHTNRIKDLIEPRSE